MNVPLTIRVLVIGAAGAMMMWSQDAVRISEEEGRKLAVTKVAPDYPATAKTMRLAGKVTVDVFIDEDGKVDKAQQLSGNPLLSSAAIAAVKRWKFTPFSANGQAKKAVTTISFDFKL